MFEIVLYKDRRGKEPVQEFIDSLSWKTQEKILTWLNRLEQEGPFLRRPYADKIRGKLYELRIRFSSDHIRIIYFFFHQGKVVLLHGFRKKEWEIKERDIELAERRMNEFTQLYGQRGFENEKI